MLDEGFRRRVAALAETPDVSLDEEAHARILNRVATEGPRIVRRARRARVAVLALGPALAAAAAVSVWGLGRHHERQPVAPVEAKAGPAPRVRACESRQVPAGAARGFVAADGGEKLELAGVAVAVAEAASVVRLEEASACRTTLRLDAGTVMVHAKDLGGGELRVRAPGADVVVHGTVFAVSSSPGSVVVEVAEGRVSVIDKAGEHFVSAGERLLLSSVGVGQGALAQERAFAILRAVGAPVVVGLDTLPQAGEAPSPAPAEVRPQPGRGLPGTSAPAPTTVEPVAAATVELGESTRADGPPGAVPAPADPLTEAERARKAGDFGRARELYRAAADRTGPTAEAAWVALARMELGLGHVAGALEATRQRQQRFGQGTLAPEALWIDVRAYRQSGDLARARDLAAELVRRWPGSPQARAAERWAAGE